MDFTKNANDKQTKRVNEKMLGENRDADRWRTVRISRHGRVIAASLFMYFDELMATELEISM